MQIWCGKSFGSKKRAEKRQSPPVVEKAYRSVEPDATAGMASFAVRGSRVVKGGAGCLLVLRYLTGVFPAHAIRIRHACLTLKIESRLTAGEFQMISGGGGTVTPPPVLITSFEVDLPSA